MMNKLWSWILTPIYLLFSFGSLIIFNVLFILIFPVNYWLFKKTLDLGICSLIAWFRVIGARVVVDWRAEIPENAPVIIVSNHQSIFDIPLMLWIFRKFDPKFVAKRELGRGIPSVSYVLRHNGSALIDRDNPQQSVRALKELGELIEQKRCAACIFPEGTRGREGKMRAFKPAGLLCLLKSAPNAYIVPITIQGSWQLARYKLLPVPVGVKIQVTILDVFANKPTLEEEIVEATEKQIRGHLGEPLTPTT